MVAMLMAALAGAAAQAPLPEPKGRAGEEWVLPPLRVIRPCPEPDGNEIVVCGNADGSRFRMPAIRIPPNLDVEPDELLRFGLGGGTEGEIEATQQQRLDGWLDRRILLHVRVPF